MDIAQIAIVAIPAFAAGALGMASLNTLLGRNREESPNMGEAGGIPDCDIEPRHQETLMGSLDSAQEQIGRLNREIKHWMEWCANWISHSSLLLDELVRSEAENADLRIDIAAKAQRLEEHGLQSSGGIDPTVSA